MIDIQKHFEPLQNWLDSLDKRERTLVISGVIFLLVNLFYFAVWDPVINGLETEQQKYESERQLYYWMKDAVSEYKALQSSGGQITNRFKNQSISSLTDRSAQSTGIKQHIKKLDSSDKGVKVELEQVSFDQLIIWLSDLSQKYSIQASSLQIEKLAEPGSVNARISLERDPA